MTVLPFPVLVQQNTNQDAVELVEQLLERLWSGEVVDVALVQVTRDGSVSTVWSKGESYHRLNSGAARLANRLASEED